MSGGADNGANAAVVKLKPVFPQQELLHIIPEQVRRLLGGVGLAGIINPAILCRFLRWFPTEEETTRPGGTRQERDKLW